MSDGDGYFSALRESARKKAELKKAELKTQLGENKSFFVKALVFAVVCILLYWVVPVIAMFWRASPWWIPFIVDGFPPWSADAFLWAIFVGLTLRELWNWEL